VLIDHQEQLSWFGLIDSTVMPSLRAVGAVAHIAISSDGGMWQP
jgi:hypothetical protein